MPEYGSVKRHPLLSLLYLVIFMVLGYSISSLLALGVIFLINGQSGLALDGSGSKNMLLFVQALGSIGTFIIPPLIFDHVEKRFGVDNLKLSNKISWRLLILTVVIIFSVSPFIDWTIKINQMIDLPSFMQGVEEWMRNKERELSELTRQLLVMKSPLDLVVILFVVAVIPAIGEEFLFRGCFQSIIARITNNKHTGIWVAAILFSAIHVQFLGFFPRMFLGALFGYLFVWSGSIWPSVLAHFINNATAVVGAYILQIQNKPLDIMDNPDTTILIATISLIFTFVICWVYYRTSQNEIREKNTND